MQFSVTFRHMEGTSALKDYARDRLERIKKYFPDPMSVNVVMSTERYNHRADVNVMLHNGITLAGHETTENMYSSIDLVVAKILRQVRKYKDKLRTHKVKSDFQPIPWTHTVLAEPEAPAEKEELVEEEKPADPPVLKTERMTANPMAVPEAVMQLNLIQEQFLVFRNSDTGEINVVYRRSDGAFGLIEAAASN